MINQIWHDLSRIVENFVGDLGVMALLGMVGVALIAVALPVLLIKPKDRFEKLDLRGVAEKPVEGEKRALRIANTDNRLDRYKQFLEPTDAKELDATRLKLVRAGYRNRDAVRNFHFAQFALGVGGLVVGLIYGLFFSGGSIQAVALSVVIPGALGYMLPRYIVTKRLQSRMEEIELGFPDTLDLMLVCVEAGQSLDQAIVRVSKELRAAYPALADELEIVAYELKAGKDRATVLREFAHRVDLQDVRSFVTTLIQSTSFGSSISEAIRVYADEMRDKRVMRAEEKANKLPTKLTLGTMVFCLPPLLLILVGPAIYDILQNFSGGN
jgi:tight adherence protein C